MRVVVVGGVAGGATAATRLRRISEEAGIILFERGYHVSYANCGLPYYIGGEIEKCDDLFITSPERLRILVQNGFKAMILSGGIETWLPLHEDMAADSAGRR
jgi:NADPH-dependent 2,4-dienoyl-CoA reductase/sulfur reductase-like enzyme